MVMPMAKFPTMEEFAKEAAQIALDDFEYEGKTIREWTELILSGKLVEAIRCKDCWNAKKYCGGLYCKFYEQTMDEDDFCSKGERRTNG